MSDDTKKPTDRVRRRPEDAEAANRAIQQEHLGGVAPSTGEQDPTRRPPSPGTAGLARGYGELPREREAEEDESEQAPRHPKRST